jgi:flagellar biosynthesis protein FlhG
MSDQAQGLRALANQARHDHIGTPFPVDTAPLNSGDAPYVIDVLNPQAPAVETQVAAVNARLRESSSETGAGLTALPGAAVPPESVFAVSRVQAPRRMARVIAITSGKGGVGKTNFCSNLALTLAARGQRVIIVDADLGMANVHVILGVSPPFHMEHVMRGEKTLAEILYQAPGGVGIISGGSGLTDLANLDDAERQRFISSLSELDSLADVVLLDTGAGLSHNVLAFLCAVEEVIVITTPEPPAIMDAYATIKVIARENPHAQQRLVVNMAQSEAEARAVAQRLQSISQQFLGRDMNWLGYLPHDMTVSRAVRAQQPFTTLQPNAPVSRAILQIADKLGFDKTPPASQTAGVSGLLNQMQRFFGLRSS